MGGSALFVNNMAHCQDLTNFLMICELQIIVNFVKSIIVCRAAAMPVKSGKGGFKSILWETAISSGPGIKTKLSLGLCMVRCLDGGRKCKCSHSVKLTQLFFFLLFYSSSSQNWGYFSMKQIIKYVSRYVEQVAAKYYTLGKNCFKFLSPGSFTNFFEKFQFQNSKFSIKYFVKSHVDKKCKQDFRQNSTSMWSA